MVARRPTFGQAIKRSSGYVLSSLITLPYYRFYRQNTLLPILAIMRSVRERESDDVLFQRTRYWRERKLREFQFVQVAGTLLAAAVIGCFSWVPNDGQHWLGPAAWYSCLVLSLFAILLSSSEAFIFSTIKDVPGKTSQARELAMIARVEPITPQQPQPTATDGREKGKGRQRQDVQVKIKWIMVFTWQAPIMLVAYAVICFLAGLTIYVCTPLYDGLGFRGESKASIFYLVSFVASGATFVWCSFWAYRFIDLDEQDLYTVG
ncbi:hypothetical protein B0T17DRAFT_485085 [Bombardia bombarda]|uniref:Uncharacterized protein n=1 Tax=Bombardia bombarda TaxID=252184 RepID=A0AA39XMI0_9PEZI|nr:hypothetical protein B0T17DRAFT_485085 [Bombardia bombarda]